MAYWVKARTISGCTYSDEGGELNYNLCSYDGPFRNIYEVGEYLRSCNIDDAEIIELE